MAYGIGVNGEIERCPSDKLKGKVAVITGGGSGIGRATAHLFSREGAKVVVCDINAARAMSVASELVAGNKEAVSITTDVSSEPAVESMMQNVKDIYGQIDILFNNAAVILPKFIEQIENHEWQRVLGVNLSGVFYCTKYALPYLKSRHGSIVNMASMNGLVGQMRNPAYSATKGAVIALTKSLAVDLAPLGVRVNAICPAGVMTPLLEEWFQQQPNPERARSDCDLSHMMGRIATADEIAQLALFLASNDASFITGQAIPIEGGATLGYGVGPKPEWSRGGGGY